MIKNLKKLTLLYLSLLLMYNTSWANDKIPITSDSVIAPKLTEFPSKLKPSSTIHALFLTFSWPPLEWTDVPTQMPVIQYKLKIGMPYSLIFQSIASSEIVSNQIRSGIQWNKCYGKLGFNIGLDAAFTYWEMSISGSHNHAIAKSGYTYFSIGYEFHNLYFTLNAELYFVSDIKIETSDVFVEKNKNFVGARTISIFIGQPVWNKHNLVLGLSNNFARISYSGWPVLSISRTAQFFPQFHIGFIF
jgi:hypothetical protein